MLFLHISIFLVAILFSSFAYIKPTIPRSNRLFVSKEPDEYNRVLELIGNLAKSQDKTEELIGNLAKSQAKTEIKLRQLIGYNSNRDQELEDAIEEALFRKLQDSGWNVVRVGFTEIYQDNRLILEWDGIIEAKHVESSRNVLFVIETKQIFTVEKFESFRKRFAKMKKALDKVNVDGDLWPYKDFQLCGVIASPVIKSDVEISNFTYITLKQDQFEVFLAI